MGRDIMMVVVFENVWGSPSVSDVARLSKYGAWQAQNGKRCSVLSAHRSRPCEGAIM